MKKFWNDCARVPGAITPLQCTEEIILRDVNDLLFGAPSEFLESASLLDLGCGEGRLMPELARRVGKYTGADVSTVVLDRARAFAESLRLGNVSLVELADGAHGELGDIGPFDIVVSWTVFMHLPQRIFRAYLGSVHKVLKPQGLFNFQVPLSGTEDARFNVVPDSDLWKSRWYSAELVHSYLTEEGFFVAGFPVGGQQSWRTVRSDG